MWQIPAVLVLISVLFNSATADDRWPSAELLSEKFNEELFKETPVSSSTLAGVVIEQPTSKQSDNLQIFVYWPHTHPPGTICLTVQTRDGTYRSQNPYRIPQVNASTYIRLPYPSVQRDFLREQDAQSIALLAQVGECTPVADGPIIPAVSGPPASVPPQNLLILSNAGRASAFLEVHAKGKTSLDRITCLPVRGEERRTVFDTLCTLDVSKIGNEILQMYILEKRYGDEIRNGPWTIQMGY